MEDLLLSLSLEKNASKRRNKTSDVTDTTKANTTTGANTTSNTTPLKVFNANGELVTTPAGDYKAPKS